MTCCLLAVSVSFSLACFLFMCLSMCLSVCLSDRVSLSLSRTHTHKHTHKRKHTNPYARAKAFLDGGPIVVHTTAGLASLQNALLHGLTSHRTTTMCGLAMGNTHSASHTHIYTSTHARMHAYLSEQASEGDGGGANRARNEPPPSTPERDRKPPAPRRPWPCNTATHKM